ncbi:MAG: GIY-YIG nuclease family protein [Chitinophagaceae bacterium]|jgi:putative endonuclease|nr:MAG: GIY-YIG nuclease family protein [Chitinophagaceae bacterium]
MKKGGFVYILTNKNNTVLYTGVTSSLVGRVWQHKVKFFEKSFTARYNINKLVYYQFYATIDEAIEEEKRIKGGSRKKKIELIESLNPEWNDLWEEISK